MEICPKWTALKEILEEIKKEEESSSEDVTHGRILIAPADHKTCKQISLVYYF